MNIKTLFLEKLLYWINILFESYSKTIKNLKFIELGRPIALEIWKND